MLPKHYLAGKRKSTIFVHSIFYQMKKETKKKIGEWLMDVSKYMLTAVLISSFFKDLENKWVIYVACSIAVIFSFYIGVDMFDKNNKN